MSHRAMFVVMVCALGALIVFLAIITDNEPRGEGMSTRADRRRLQKSIAALHQRVQLAGAQHHETNARHGALLARLPRHYQIQRALGIPRLAALRIAWKLSCL